VTAPGLESDALRRRGGAPLTLDLEILKEELEERYPVEALLTRGGREELTDAVLYCGQEELEEDLIYVAPTEVFRRFPIQNGSVCRVQVGEWDAGDDRNGGPALIVGGSSDWREVFNAIQAVFRRHYSFARRLGRILNRGGTVNKLTVAAGEFLQHPICVHDAKYHVIALANWGKETPPLQMDPASGGVIISPKTVRRLRQNPDYIQSLSARRAGALRGGDGSYNLYVNVFSSDGTLCGRVWMNRPDGAGKTRELRMLEYFAELLTLAYEREVSQTSAAGGMEEVLRRYCQTDDLDSDYLLQRMQMVGWLPDDRYVCMRIHPGTGTLFTPARIKESVRVFLPESFSYQEGRALLTLCRIGEHRIADFPEPLKKLLQDSGLDIAIGNAFHDLTKLRAFFLQTLALLDIGRRRDPDAHFYTYRSYALDYIALYHTREAPLEMICPVELMELYRLSDKESRETLQTLRVFLQSDGRQSRAAERLYIHRSTVVYRIGKIRQLLKLNLDDHRERVTLQLLMELLDAQFPDAAAQ